MICPNCLSNNRSNALICKNCGCPLDDIKHTDISEDNDNISKTDINETDNLRYTVTEVVAPDIDYDEPSIEDELSQDTINISPIRVSSPVRRPRGTSDNSGLSYSRPVSHSSRKKRRTTLVFTIILWLIIIGGLITGIVFGVKYVSDLFGNNEPSQTQSASKAPASAPDIAIKTDSDGKQYINCVFYGKDGDSVRIEQLNKRYNFENGIVEVNLYLSDLLSSTAVITTDTVPVTIKATYRYSDGTETALDVPSVEFSVPSTSITLLNTDGKAVEIYKDTFTLVFAIPQGSNLYINDTISNDKVDSTGRVKYTVSVGAGESINVSVRAQAPYQKSAETMFTIYRQELNTKLTLANSNPKTTESNIINITGTIDVGSTVTCGGSYQTSDFTLNEATGVFSLKVTLPGYGIHDIVFTATDPSGKTAKLTHTVSYMPNEDSYTRKAWAYEESVATNPGQYMNKSFLFANVKIEDFILAEDTMFLINMGTSEAPQYIYVQYSGNITLNKTTTYRIFGDVIGVYDGKTLVAARFIYTW